MLAGRVSYMTRVCARSFSTDRPFKVLGLQQVAIGNLTKDALKNFWGDTMGLAKVHSFKSQKENVDEDVYEMGKGVAKVEVDLMAPLNPDKSPKVHIPPLNHIGLWIDDLPKCVEYLTKKGIKTVGGIRKGASGFDVTFVHPKSACGILLELVQAPKNIIDEFNKI